MCQHLRHSSLSAIFDISTSIFSSALHHERTEYPTSDDSTHLYIRINVHRLLFRQITRRYTARDTHLHGHQRPHLKSYHLPIQLHTSVNSNNLSCRETESHIPIEILLIMSAYIFHPRFFIYNEAVTNTFNIS